MSGPWCGLGDVNACQIPSLWISNNCCKLESQLQRVWNKIHQMPHTCAVPTPRPTLDRCISALYCWPSVNLFCLIYAMSLMFFWPAMRPLSTHYCNWGIITMYWSFLCIIIIIVMSIGVFSSLVFQSLFPFFLSALSTFIKEFKEIDCSVLKKQLRVWTVHTRHRNSCNSSWTSAGALRCDMKIWAHSTVVLFS